MTIVHPTLTDTQRLRCAEDVAEAKRRAAQAWALLTDDQRAAVEALKAEAPDRLRRLFSAGSDAKGRANGKLLTGREFLRWQGPV
jgi:hypothetical protein